MIPLVVPRTPADGGERDLHADPQRRVRRSASRSSGRSLVTDRQPDGPDRRRGGPLPRRGRLLLDPAAGAAAAAAAARRRAPRGRGGGRLGRRASSARGSPTSGPTRSSRWALALPGDRRVDRRRPRRARARASPSDVLGLRPRTSWSSSCRSASASWSARWRSTRSGHRPATPAHRDRAHRAGRLPGPASRSRARSRSSSATSTTAVPGPDVSAFVSVLTVVVAIALRRRDRLRGDRDPGPDRAPGGDPRGRSAGASSASSTCWSRSGSFLPIIIVGPISDAVGTDARPPGRGGGHRRRRHRLARRPDAVRRRGPLVRRGRDPAADVRCRRLPPSAGSTARRRAPTRLAATVPGDLIPAPRPTSRERAGRASPSSSPAGTISMTVDAGAGGAVPDARRRRPAGGACPASADVADVVPIDLGRTPASHFSFADVLRDPRR